MKATRKELKKDPEHIVHKLIPTHKLYKTIYMKCTECKKEIQMSKKEITKEWGIHAWKQINHQII